MRSKPVLSVTARAAALTELALSTVKPFLRSHVCIMVAYVRSSSTIRILAMPVRILRD